MICLKCVHAVVRKLRTGPEAVRDRISCSLDGWVYERGGVESCNRFEPRMVAKPIEEEKVDVPEEVVVKKGWPLGKKRR